MADLKVFTTIPLHKGVPPLDEINPQRGYITITNGYAFITNGRTLIVANLTDKFVADLDDEVIDYLEGKYLSKEYWEALTKANQIDVVDDLLHLKSTGSSTFLEYENPPFVHSENFLPLDFSNHIIKNDSFASTVNVSLNFASLDMFAKASGMNKTDRFIFSTNGPDKPVKVFINSRDGIFALVSPEYDDTTDIFFRAPLQTFVINYRKNEADSKERKLNYLKGQAKLQDEADFEFEME